MKVLLLGSNGMLGSYITSSEEIKAINFHALSRKADIRCDFNYPDKVITLIDSMRPNVVINCVAVTSFEQCEQDYEGVFKVNCDTPSRIAEWCQQKNISFVHISTDHFYDGDGSYPHSETDKVKIVNKYAQSKYLAEQKILKYSTSLVIRTSIIGRTADGLTFLDWIFNSIKSKYKVGLFYDAYTSFVHCSQLSSLIFTLISKEASGLFNVSCNEVFSKAEFCLGLAKKMGFKIDSHRSSSDVLEIPRAKSCGLSCSKVKKEFDLDLPSLDDVINICVAEDRNLDLTNK